MKEEKEASVDTRVAHPEETSSQDRRGKWKRFWLAEPANAFECSTSWAFQTKMSDI